MKSQIMLKLKLVDPPCELLEHVADLCRRGTNAAVEDWLLRERGKPPSEKQQRPGRKGKGLHPSTKLYHAVTAAVPTLSADIATCLANKLWSNLNAKLDWRRRDGKPRKRMDAILDYEDRPPWNTSDMIPAPNKNVTIQFGDELRLTLRNVMRGEAPLCMDISLKGMPTGKKRIIRECMDGERKLSDSQIVKKQLRNGSTAWFFYFCTAQESEPLDDSVSVTLTPLVNGAASKTDRPFRVIFPSGGYWNVGDGRYLWAQTKRLDGLAKHVGYRYRNGNGPGHGRKKVDKAVRRRRGQLRNIRDEFRRRCITDIIRQCERQKAGTIVYREPTLPVRTKTWFAAAELEFDWTRFLGDLKNSAARRGITVEKKALKMAEVKDEADATV
jgi:hypothetical protein